MNNDVHFETIKSQFTIMITLLWIQNDNEPYMPLGPLFDSFHVF